MDGSTSPPGDRIDCNFGIAPGEREVRLQVVAYVVTAGKPPVRVRATTNRNNDGKGLFSVNLAVPEITAVGVVPVVIPYADMSLPAGEHQIGYVVTMYVGNELIRSQPLPATQIRINNNTSTELKPQSLGRQQGVPSYAGNAQLNDGKYAQSRRMQINGPTGSRSIDTPARAEVRGGFERKQTPPRATKNAELAALASQPWQPLSDVAPKHEDRVVFFATNRVANDPTQMIKPPSRTTYGATLSSTITYGQCTVNFPVRYHKQGSLEAANWWQQPDPDHYFLIETVQALSSSDMVSAFGKDDVLLFVHGFNTSFDYAVLRAGQLQYDAEFPGKVMAFSWPSLGDMSQYKVDAQTAEQSYRALADVLDVLSPSNADGTERGKVHVIAHSLGNRVFLGALHDLMSRGVWKDDEKHLGQVVLAAPDVGTSRFNNTVGYALAVADRLTYYYCRADLALATSQQINFYEPVGMYPYFQSGLDTINCDGIGTDFMVHSYYGSSPKVLADLHLLLCSSSSPDKRMPPLSTHSRVYGHDHWSFLPVEIKEQ
jgi:esterase/lipase superfamily enzyme